MKKRPDHKGIVWATQPLVVFPAARPRGRLFSTGSSSTAGGSPTKAALLCEHRTPLPVVDRAIPQVDPEGVMWVIGAGVRHTDLHIIDGEYPICRCLLSS